MFTCEECGREFQDTVWECPFCNQHWPMEQAACPDCTAPTIDGPQPRLTPSRPVTSDISESFNESVINSGRSLVELEGVIERGVQTFIEVGQALLEIRSRRLYHDQDYTTFEDYCRERWGFNRQHAHRLIDAARVVSILEEPMPSPMSPMGDIGEMGAEPVPGFAPLPASERQTRELSKIDDPGEMRETWKETIETHGAENVTAAKIASVRAAREERRSPTYPLRPPSTEEESRDRTEQTRQQIEHERKQRYTHYLANSLSHISELFRQREAADVANDWIEDSNPLQGLPDLGHLWTSDGIRACAVSLDALADVVERRGGRL